MNTKIFRNALPFLACALMYSLNAQQVERRISDMGEDAVAQWPVRIAVTQTGLRWVAWTNASQAISPDGTPISANEHYTATDGVLVALDGDSLAFLKQIDSSWTESEYRRSTVLRRFDIRDPWLFIRGSDTVFYSRNHDNGWWDGTSDIYQEAPRRMTFAQSDKGILVGTVFSSFWKPGTVYYARQEPRWTFWNGEQHTYQYRGPGSDATWPFNSGNNLLLAAMSESGHPYLLRRLRSGEHRDIFILDRLMEATGEIATTLYLDTLEVATDDRLTTFIPYDNGAVDILCLIPDTDTLTVRRYGIDGRLSDVRILCPEISILQGYPDVFHLALPGGAHLLSWSRVDAPDRTRLYVQSFDAGWNALIAPRLVSSVEAELQAASGMALHGDDLDIAWFDTRDVHAGIYLGTIPTASLTAIEEAGAVETAILSVYPNPVPSGIHVITLPLPARTSGTLRVSLFDYLGREAHFMRQEIQPGEQLLRCELPALSPGVYLLRVGDASQVHIRRLVLQ